MKRETVKENLIYGVPVVVIVLLVMRYGVNVLWWDEWEMVSYLSEGVSLKFLATPHNEHMMLFPKILIVLSNWLFSWNSKAQMIVSVVLITIAYSMIVKYISSILEKGKIVSAICGFIILSPVQYFNFLMGFQIAFTCVTLMTVLAFYGLHKYYQDKKLGYIVGTFIFASIAAFSSLQGLCVWIAVIICCILECIFEKNKSKLKLIAIEVMFFIIVVITYCICANNVTGNLAIGEMGILSLLRTFLIVLGGVCGNRNEQINIICGLVILLCMFFLYRDSIVKNEIKKDLFGIGMSMTGIGCVLAISLGRIAYGTSTVLAWTDRYCSFSILIILGLSILLINRNKGNVVIFGCTILVIIGFSYLPEWKKSFENRIFVKYVVQNYRSCSVDELQQVYPWGTYSDAYKKIYELEKRKINAFKDNEINIEDSVSIKYAEQENTGMIKIGFEKMTVKFDDKFMSFIGPYVVDYYDSNKYEKIYIKVNNELYLPHRDHVIREDLVAYYNDNNYLYSGFIFSLPIAELVQGENEISILVFYDGGTKYCQSNIVRVWKTENELLIE
ncbi:MAG: hypothetical protein J6A77_10060 [Lachnospiraceae bacterium]|nr:hypothetical protein [Lachnospiraceae bacterium]